VDTRSKIITAARAIEIVRDLRRNGSSLKIVTGYFDVLRAGHLRRLKTVSRDTEEGVLLVILLTPPEPILPLRSRAELVAALAVVDYVVPAEEASIGDLLRQFRPDEIVREEAADERRTHELVRHVHRRQAG
jgi:D-beta-D-heptose 7-phosphate kinase/D-beta-D-heptose 1-phosphate adenosyltransferase